MFHDTNEKRGLLFSLIALTYIFIVSFLIQKSQGQTHNVDKLAQIVSLFQSVHESQLFPVKKSSILEGDTDALYTVSTQLFHGSMDLFGSQRISAAMFLLEYAAEKGHVRSQVMLGNIYVKGKETSPSVEKSVAKALHYFQLAGEQGHHASLYNAGYLLAMGDSKVEKDIVGSFAYLHSAASLHLKYPEDADPKITDVAKQAILSLSRTVTEMNLSIRQLADIFLFGSDAELAPDLQDLWVTAVTALMQFNQTFVDTEGRIQDRQQMGIATESLKTILQVNNDTLSDLQRYLALDNLNDMLGPLAAMDESYVMEAGKYAEELALTHLCRERYAVSEKDSACFNGAAASAVSYYRRMGDMGSAERVRLMANDHPDASTHWRTILQTPRVFHPNLRSKPWWDANDFSAAVKLRLLFEDKMLRLNLIKEIRDVIALQEGSLRGVELVLDADSGASEKNRAIAGGFQRIFTPYIGIRTQNSETNEKGAGGWAEFGPLFDGFHWSEERCSVVPTVCKALQGDESLCSSFKRSFVHFSGAMNNWDLCGSGTIVTILRLRPGTAILPHCGTTNSRLIMHFPILGASGVRFVVGDETVYSYGGGDGHPIVFDDSYEHHVYHEGDQDRFVVLAVLGHPDLNRNTTVI